MNRIEELKNSLIKEKDPKKFSTNIDELGDIYSKTNDSSIAKFILELFDKSKTDAFRIHCLRNLAKLNFISENSKNLIPFLRKRKSEVVIHTLKALNSFEDFHDEDILIELLEEKKDNYVKTIIIDSLSKIGSIKSANKIISIFKRSRDLNITITAYKALKIINEKYQSPELYIFLEKNHKKWYKNFKLIEYDNLINAIKSFLKESTFNNIYLEFKLDEEFTGYTQIYIKKMNNNSWWSLEYGFQNSRIDYFNSFINEHPFYSKHCKFDDLDFEKNLNQISNTIIDFFEIEFKKVCEVWKKPDLGNIKTLISNLKSTEFEEHSFILGFLKTKIGMQSEYLDYTYDKILTYGKLYESLNYINSKKTKANNGYK